MISSSFIFPFSGKWAIALYSIPSMVLITVNVFSSLIHNKGYLPAYHMNKQNRITVLLDGSVADDEIKDLIRLSYEIIEKKK